jgi:uncharacterized protein Veg
MPSIGKDIRIQLDGGRREKEEQEQLVSAYDLLLMLLIDF